MNNPRKPIIFIPSILILLLLVLFALLVVIKSRSTQPEQKIEKEKSSVEQIVPKGVNYLPKGSNLADQNDFFEKAKLSGSFVTWAGDWMELSGHNPTSITERVKNNDLEPVIIASYYNQGAKKLLRPTTEATLKKYQETTASFAEKYKPKYIGFGIEINIMYENDPIEFEKFVSLFNETVDLVKTKSPETKVFTVFQLERLKGLKGGLFGGQDDTKANNWSLLENFSKADLFAFTSYPYLIFKNPSDIPTDYYTEIKLHSNKPIAFTEVAWASKLTVRGWESSEADQATFVSRFFELTTTLKPEMIIWPFIYDPPTSEPFASIGLIKKDGTPKPAWATWLKAQ